MYRIVIRTYKNGELVGEGVSTNVYVRKGNAERAARNLYRRSADSEIQYKWNVVDVYQLQMMKQAD